MEATGFEINMQNWRMGDYSDFFAAGARNDFERQFELMTKVVRAWVFEGNPSEAASYRNLGVDEFKAVLRAIGQAINSSFTQGN